ncbi:ABC transporter substrate-binding protein (plasmid) [Fulvitalea axinellae]|uniref:ABC transporter substrate-binding protein n=1 Tax=Fulvitalea axinellae TaxID=1182444 RepID=A0AAU9DAI8_9BACT|nr:ABC transporter substrate-binding protein [Fulvitalea axinellae]
MLFYYLKISIRRLLRDKVYATVNILGLALAMMSSLLLFNYAYREWRTDKWHSDADNVYRVLQKGEKYVAGFPYDMLDMLRQGPPEILDGVRLLPVRRMVHYTDSGSVPVKAKVFETERSFFQVFDYSIGLGEVGNFEIGSKKAVISERIAKRLFGDRNPVGLQLPWKESGSKGEGHIVVAVMRGQSEISSLQADVFLTFNPKKKRSYAYETYLKLAEGVNPEEIQNRFPDFGQLEEVLGPLIRHRGEAWRLQAFKDIYLNSSDVFSYCRKQGSLFLVAGTFMVGLLILLIAWYNYGTIAGAISIKHKKTDRLRRYIGERTREVVLSHFLDTGIHILLASSLSLLFLPLFDKYVRSLLGDKQLLPFSYDQNFATVFILTLFLFWILLLASKYKMITFRNRTVKIKDSRTVVQFAIVLILLVCSTLFIKQLRFMSDHSGLRLENLVFTSLPSQSKIKGEWMEEVFRKEMMASGLALDYSIASPMPNPYQGAEGQRFHLLNRSETKLEGVAIQYGDDRFLSIYGIELLKGRNLDKKTFSFWRSEDPNLNKQRTSEALVNKKFIEKMGLKAPLGKKIVWGNMKFKIVGVINDFHHESFYGPIKPLVVFHDQIYQWADMAVIRAKPGKEEAVAEFAREQFEKHRQAKGQMFFYQVYDIANLYQSELYFGKTLALFTALGLFIVCLGLFGVSYFTAETRTKEIGIRKANGATTFEILRLLNSSTLKQVAVAFVIAVPIAYYAMGRWLENFAYKTEMSWWVFAGAGLLAGLVALATVSWQSWRAASREPVEALRYE